MNDRFRFRAWQESTKRMFENSQLNMAVKNLKNEGGTFDVIMQCTGLRDKNGVLIFEGDVVEFGKSGKIPFYAVCDFEGCGFGLRVYESKDFIWFDDELAETAHLYEIISNKFQNPELLQQ